MRIRHRLAYDASSDQVYRMVSDPAFRESVCRALGTVSHEVRVDPTADGMAVRIDMVQRTHMIPGFARRVVGEESRVVQSEEWVAGERADLTVEIPGRPGHISGHVTLLADGDRTVETFDGEATVAVPLLGRRLERLVASLFVEGMDTEHRVGTAWLAGVRG